MAFFGQDGFEFGIGVVEDRFDPLQLGRVRVRWLGLHDEDKDKILTKDLPWSEVMQSAHGNPAAGVGQNSTLTEGSWVCGFTKDPSTLQDWIIMGTLPGWNVTTAIGSGVAGGKWAEYRGPYKEFTTKPGTVSSSSDIKSFDYEKGFADPTVDQRNIPHPPSYVSWRSPVSVPAATYVKVDWTKEGSSSVTDGWPQVPDENNDFTYVNDIGSPAWVYPTTPSTAQTRATHSDTLHALFGTTRRITADKRFANSWTHFGTFKWPDVRTYSLAGDDTAPKEQETGRNVESPDTLYKTGRDGVIFSTGYLEPNFTAVDSSGAPVLPLFPVMRDLPAVSFDPTAYTGITNTDTRFTAGSSGYEVGDWASTQEDFRLPNPRVNWLSKGSLSPTERKTVMDLFDSGQYGSGVYNINSPKLGRHDIEWKDVSENDLVIVPKPDTNPLAMGGIPISGIDNTFLKVTTQSKLWGDTSYFATAERSTGNPAIPTLQAGDIVQLAGVRGMQEVNGRIFRCMSCSESDGTFTMELGTVNGSVWAGPAPISWKTGGTGLGTATISDQFVATSSFSAYLEGGVVIPHHPHWSLCWKADQRERQINIGSPNAVTGIEYGHWNQPSGDFNARYPFNHVYESESGHLMEYDDTPGGERIQQMHRSGTYYEIDHNGTKVDYVKGDNYDIRIHDDYMYVKGKVAHTFDDEVMIRYNDRADISAKWKLQLWSGGDLEITSKRNINLKSDGDINMQAGGHINMNATGLTPTSSENKAGSRNPNERSKIRMKAGHLEVEMIGNETLQNEYGITLQSNQSGIMIKTLLGYGLVDNERTMSGDINIASAADMNLYAYDNHYREASLGNIEDFAQVDSYLTAETGSIYETAQAESIYYTAKKAIDIKACGIDGVSAGTVDIWAKESINIKADSSADTALTNTGLINIQAIGRTDVAVPAGTTGHISIVAPRYIQTFSGNVSVDAAYNINMKAGTAAASAGTINLETQSGVGFGSDINIKSNAGFSMESANNANILVTGASQMVKMTTSHALGTIHMNSSGEAAASAGSATVTPTTAAATATSASGAMRSYIPNSLELLSIDLPEPRPAMGTSITMLALNANLANGYGGENIRNLQDTIADMQSGVSAYWTKEGVATSAGGRTYVTDQNNYDWDTLMTDSTTTTTEAPWTGYTEEYKKVEPLGNTDNTGKRNNPSTRATGDVVTDTKSPC